MHPPHLLAGGGVKGEEQPLAWFKVLAKNPMNQMVMATPAIVRGSLFVRTATHLIRIARKR